MEIWNRTDISWDEKQKLHLEQLEKEKRETDELKAKLQNFAAQQNFAQQSPDGFKSEQQAFMPPEIFDTSK